MAEHLDYKFTLEDTGPWLISLEQDCREYFWALTDTYGLVWHPDTRFEDYVDLETGEPVFSPNAARIMDEAMGRCFAILADKTYDVALEVYNQWNKLNEKEGNDGDSLSVLREDN